MNLEISFLWRRSGRNQLACGLQHDIRITFRLIQIANDGVINWITLKPVVIAPIGTGVSYLTKNLLSNSKGGFMRGERQVIPWHDHRSNGIDTKNCTSLVFQHP